MKSQAVDSLLMVPLLQGGSWIGLVGLDSCGLERIWREEEIVILRHLARLLSIALERRYYLATRGKLARIREILAEGEAADTPDWFAQKYPPEQDQSLQAVERRAILTALELFQGNRLQAAKHLGLTWPALDRRCKKMDIDVKKRG